MSIIFAAASAVFVAGRHYGLYLAGWLYWAGLVLLAVSAVLTFASFFAKDAYTPWEAVLLPVLALDMAAINAVLNGALCVCLALAVTKAAKRKKYAAVAVAGVLLFTAVIRILALPFTAPEGETVLRASSPNGKTEVYSCEQVIGDDTFTDYFAVESFGVARRRVMLASLFGEAENAEFVSDSVIKIGGTYTCMSTKLLLKH